MKVRSVDVWMEDGTLGFSITRPHESAAWRARCVECGCTLHGTQFFTNGLRALAVHIEQVHTDI